ncbi:MAG: hypothetical protein WCW77_05915 [Patescibacteria group bacterium]|jgi:hypothetical protein
MTRAIKILLIIAGTLAVVSVIFSGIVYNNNNKSKLNSEPATSLKEIIKEPENGNQDKLILDKKYDSRDTYKLIKPFTFKYPQNWELIEGKGGIEIRPQEKGTFKEIVIIPGEYSEKVCGINNPCFDELWYQKKDNTSIEDWCINKLINEPPEVGRKFFSREEFNQAKKDIISENKVIDDNEAYIIRYKDWITACIDTDTGRYEIRGDYLDDNDFKVYNAILDTFKFIK